MQFVEIRGLPRVALPNHSEVYSRQIWGPATGGQKILVSYTEMRSDGGAEMHSHEGEHVFIVLKGELQVNDGATLRVVGEGGALVVEPGEPHQVTGTGKADCVYITVTSLAG